MITHQEEILLTYKKRIKDGGKWTDWVSERAPEEIRYVILCYLKKKGFSNFTLPYLGKKNKFLKRLIEKELLNAIDALNETVNSLKIE